MLNADKSSVSSFEHPQNMYLILANLGVMNDNKSTHLRFVRLENIKPTFVRLDVSKWIDQALQV